MNKKLLLIIPLLIVPSIVFGIIEGTPTMTWLCDSYSVNITYLCQTAYNTEQLIKLQNQTNKLLAYNICGNNPNNLILGHFDDKNYDAWETVDNCVNRMLEKTK